MENYYKNYVDGDWIDGGSGVISVDNPANGEHLADQACADFNDIDKAVKAAKRVHKEGLLTAMRPVERGRMVKKMGEFLLQNAPMISKELTLEAGKPLWESEIEVRGAARYFEYYGNQAETIEGKSIPLGENYYDFTAYEPYGVSAQIIPWNFPFEMTSRSLSAGLTTGNSCVVKTAENDPITQYWFAKAAEYAGFPAGSVNLLCGLGKEAGVALSSHPEVNQIVFTGSVATGSAIAGEAAKNIIPCTLELGGKSAAIVYDDADLDNLLNSLRWGIFYNAGQVCSAMSRIIVPKKLHDEISERAGELAKSLSVGPGSERKEFGNNMGSLISELQRDRALTLCQKAQSEGASTVTGGHKLNRPGWFLEPTIFNNVTPDMEIAQTEVFGPVLSIIPYETDEQALDIANGTDYGLVSGVFTKDLDRAMVSAQKMRAGQVFINEWFAGGVETPFGGYGKSGYGREKGREALWNYIQTKNIAIRLGKGAAGRA